MKSLYLLIAAFTLVFFYDSYRKYDKEINEFFYGFASSRYIDTDENTRTVTIMPAPRKNVVNDSATPIPNTEFTYSPGLFNIDDGEYLKEIGLVCVPESFGYTQARGKEVFPDFTYPKCSVKNKQNDSYIHIDRSTNTLYMNCPGNQNKNFIAGPVDDRKIVKSSELYYKWEIQDYKGPKDAKDLEFALGTCENDQSFTQATMNPKFQKKAFDSAKSKVEGRPRIIYFLTLDSMSRRHFYRKMPKVVDLLNKLNGADSEFSVFDFKLHNILGADSISNQVPIFGGLENFKREVKGDQNVDSLGKNAMWNILRKKGFISLLGLENCDNYFPGSLGRNPDVDYAVGPFYCAVQKYSGLMFDKQFERVQRCLGGHQTHYYLLNYTKTVANLNRGANLWIYNHLNAAHESTGQHAATLNDDIADFLQDFLTTFKDQYDIWIYLNADHGMRYGNWFQDTDAYQENKLPSLFVISSKSLLDKFPYSYFALKTNSERLTSKLDLRTTTFNLAGLNWTSEKSVNLLEQIANKSRLCVDCGIRSWDCACNAMEVLYKPCGDIQMILDYLVGYAERIINSASYADPRFPPGKHCKKIEIKEITKIYHVSINNVQEFYKLELLSSTQKGMKFQVNYFLASDGHARRDLGYNSESIVYGGQVTVKLLSISRLDTFAGPCEIKSRNNGIKPEYCACVD